MTKNIINDPFTSWNNGINKQTIINFVESVTDPQNSNYVESEDRIATFDNDGTLWTEKPVYFQVAFILNRIQKLAPKYPEWNQKKPFKAVLEDDREYLEKISIPELLEIVMATHAGMNQEEFERQAKTFLSTAKHPRFQKLYKKLIYQPMLELISYLIVTRGKLKVSGYKKCFLFRQHF